MKDTGKRNSLELLDDLVGEIELSALTQLDLNGSEMGNLLIVHGMHWIHIYILRLIGERFAFLRAETIFMPIRILHLIDSMLA